MVNRSTDKWTKCVEKSQAKIEWQASKEKQATFQVIRCSFLALKLVIFLKIRLAGADEVE